MKKIITGITLLTSFAFFGQNTFPSSGNVGIGTTAPSATLHVRGTSLGLSAGDELNLATIDGKAGTGNYSKLQILNRRTQSGTNWRYTSLRLQRAVDNVPMAFIDFGIEGKSYDYGLAFGTGSTPETRMVITKEGRVGIGTQNPDGPLTVKGKIHCEEVQVDLEVPADYVFEKYYTGTSDLKATYTMLTLEEVETYTKDNHHLPSIPSLKKYKKKAYI